MKAIEIKYKESERQVIAEILKVYTSRESNWLFNSPENKAFMSVIRDELASKFMEGHSQLNYKRRLKYYQAYALHKLLQGNEIVTDSFSQAVSIDLINKIGPKL